MKISQKKTCNNCRALTHDCRCELGYKIKAKYYAECIPINARPLEPCPAPKTVYESIEACRNLKKRDENIGR